MSVLEKIQDRLDKIESDFQVKIIYACESGSRAWGFASRDSDYDVRFVYRHPVEWYLSVDGEKRPDVIELPIEEDLDVCGWDLRKTLGLLYKSNPPLLEWLQSPTLYRSEDWVVKRLLSLVPEFYNPVTCRYHYLQMARNNYREYLRGDQVWLKKYLYVLRPLLAVQWIKYHNSPVPVTFVTLVKELVGETNLHQAIMDLVEQKQMGAELDRGPAVPILNRFIEQELSQAGDNYQDFQRQPIGRLNELFRQVVMRDDKFPLT